MKQRITIKIAGKNYPLSIEGGNEELYRLAEKRLSEMVSATEAKNIRDFTPQDNIAIAAFHLAVQTIDHQQRGVVESEELKQITHIEKRLSDYLNEIDPE